MRYRNKRTNAIIEIESKLTGGDWEELKASSKESRKKKAGEKNGTVRNVGRHGNNMETAEK